MVTYARSFAAAVSMLIVLSVAVPRSAGQVSFANPISYTVGTSPTAAVTGDFNGDGKMDIAVVNQGNASIGDDGGVSILLGKGDGTFEPAQNFAGGKNPSTIAIADFNHDGKLDLLVSNGVAFSAADILLGNGNGTFQAPIEVSGSGSFLSAGDLDGDGNADLVFLSVDNSYVVVLHGNGDGTFQSEVDYSIVGGTSQSPLVIGDFNGDKKLDVVVGTRSGTSILAGNGDGTLQAPVNTSFGFSGVSFNSFGPFVAADFNGDNKLDLAVATRLSLKAGILPFWGSTLFLGESNGLLRVSQPNLPVQDFGFFRASGDADGDGKRDLIYPSYVALGNGDGTFQWPLTVQVSPSSGNLAAADLNADGLVDALTVDSTNNLVNIILNKTPGFSLKPSPASMTVTAGSSATYTINIGQQNGFINAVSLTCSAPESVGVRCSVTPSSTSPGSSTQLTVTSAGLSAAIGSPGSRSDMMLYASCLPLAGVAVFGFGFGSWREPKKKLLGLTLLSLLLGSLILLSACGGTSNTGTANSSTPAGSYAITITGTSGSLQRSTTVTLSVQ